MNERRLDGSSIFAIAACSFLGRREVLEIHQRSSCQIFRSKLSGQSEGPKKTERPIAVETIRLWQQNHPRFVDDGHDRGVSKKDVKTAFPSVCATFSSLSGVTETSQSAPLRNTK